MNNGRVSRKSNEERKFKVDYDCVVCRHKGEQNKKRRKFKKERLKLKTNSKFDKFTIEDNLNCHQVESNGEVVLTNSEKLDETKNSKIMKSKKRKISEKNVAPKKNASESSRNMNSKKGKESKESITKKDSERNSISKKFRSTSDENAIANLAYDDDKNERKNEVKYEGIKRKGTKIELNEKKKIILRGKREISTQKKDKTSLKAENLEENSTDMNSKAIKSKEKLKDKTRGINARPENEVKKKLVEKNTSRYANIKNKTNIYSKRGNDGTLLKGNPTRSNSDSEIDNLQKLKTKNCSLIVDPIAEVDNVICEKTSNEIYEFNEGEEEENKYLTAIKNVKAREIESTLANENCKNANSHPKNGEKLKNTIFDFFGDKNAENSKTGNTVVGKLSISKKHGKVHSRRESEKFISEKECVEKPVIEEEEIKPQKYECKKCEKKFAFVTSLYRHNKFAHNKTKFTYTCHGCGSDFSRKDCVETHLRYHCSKNPTAKFYVCDYEYCKKKFKSRTILRKHYLEYHSENTPVFTCAYCEHSFRRKSTVSRHIPTCPSYKVIVEDFVGEFTCAHCARTFKRRINLTKHLENCKATNREITDNGLLLTEGLKFSANDGSSVKDKISDSNDTSSMVNADEEICEKVSANGKCSSLSANEETSADDISSLPENEENTGNDDSLSYASEETANDGSFLPKNKKIPANDSPLRSGIEDITRITSLVDEEVINNDGSALPKEENIVKILECSYCPSRFNRKSNLYRHERNCRVKKAMENDKHFLKNREKKTSLICDQKIPRNFACAICDFRFTRKEHLIRHAPKCEAKNKATVLQVAKNDKTLKLKRDPKIEKNPSEIKGDRNIEASSESKRDKKIKKTLSGLKGDQNIESYSELKGEQKIKKTSSELKEDQNICQKFTCDLCDRSFSRKYHLTKHISKCEDKNNALVENIREVSNQLSTNEKRENSVKAIALDELNPPLEPKNSSDSNVENKIEENFVRKKAKITRNVTLEYNTFICPKCSRSFNRKLNFTRHINAKIRKCESNNLGGGKLRKNSEVVDSYLSHETIDNNVELHVSRANSEENVHPNSSNSISSAEHVSASEKNINRVIACCDSEERVDKFSEIIIEGDVTDVDDMRHNECDQNTYLASIGLRKVVKNTEDTHFPNDSNSCGNHSHVVNGEITVGKANENGEKNSEDNVECAENASETFDVENKEEKERNFDSLIVVNEENGTDSGKEKDSEISTGDHLRNQEEERFENVLRCQNEGNLENVLGTGKETNIEDVLNSKDGDLKNISRNRREEDFQNSSQNRKEENVKENSENQEENSSENILQKLNDDDSENVLQSQQIGNSESGIKQQEEENLENDNSLNRKEEEEISLMCAKCEAVFHSERSLTQHYTSHIFANDLPCIHCDRSFEDDDMYESHLLSHYFFA